MTQDARTDLTQRIDTIESGYEFLLAYAAQGRQDDAGSNARETLQAMQAALEGLGEVAVAALGTAGEDAAAFLDAVKSDARIARGAINLVLSRPSISSLLIDNLNASVHLRALLTDLFLIEQTLKTGGQSPK
ncbi:MAG TPA: hypothetical protein VIL32_03940 [Steroidobacteraceae bacterium]